AAVAALADVVGVYRVAVALTAHEGRFLRPNHALEVFLVERKIVQVDDILQLAAIQRLEPGEEGRGGSGNGGHGSFRCKMGSCRKATACTGAVAARVYPYSGANRVS